MMIECKRTLKYLKIYIEGILHVNIPLEEYNGLQSWLEGDNTYMYYIEYYLKSGGSILCEYEDREIWENILNKVDAGM